MNLLKETVSKMIHDAYDGNESACKVYALLKGLSDQIKSGLEVIKTPAMEEAREFNKDEKYFGGTWSFSSTGNTLNYDDDLTFKDLKTKLSDRQELLKNAFIAKQKGSISIDQETGEEITIVSIKKVSVETIRFSPK